MSRMSSTERQKKKRSLTLVQPLAHRQKVAIALPLLPGLKASRLAAIALGVLGQVEHGAVVEEAAPLRVQPAQIQRCVQVAPRLGEDAAEHGGHGQDGRAHVEPEPLLLQLRRLAADPVVLLEQNDLVAARRQGAGRRQPAQAAADDADRVHAAHTVSANGGFVVGCRHQ